MPTQATFDRRSETVLGVTPGEEDELAPVASGANPLPIELSLHTDLVSIERDWRTFEERADCTVFQTIDWLSAWYRHIGVHESAKPAIVVGRHQGAILFVMPFAFDAETRTVGWLGAGLCNYNGPVLARDFPRRVGPERFAPIWDQVRQLLRNSMRLDLIDLNKMPAIIGEQSNPFCALGVTPHVNNSYSTALAADWETFYESKRSASTRRSDRKKQRRLTEFGEVRFGTAEGRDEIVRTLDALIEEKRVSYAKLGVDNMFERPGYRDFYLDLATGTHSAPMTHLSRIDVGAEVAASNFGLVFRGTYIYLLAGYNDGEVGRFGPGSMQLLEIFQYAIARGLKVFDFTIGDEPYKRDWNDTETQLYDYTAPVTLRGWLSFMRFRATRQIKRRVRTNPAIWAVARKVRVMLSALRR